MRLDGRRESTNVEDRRGGGGFNFGGGKGRVAGVGGVAALVIAAIITWISGGNPLDVLTSGQAGALMDDTSEQTYTSTADQQELVTFTKKILAGTEDVWTAQFEKMGRTYEPPKLVMFSGSTTSGCGGAEASTGPFYCSADQTVYIDLSFFEQMQDQMGAGGDFAFAYVIAHEVGHHVQYLLGTLDEAHEKMARLPEAQANQMSVRIELQADCYAGIWSYYDNQMFGSLEDGDIEEGLNAASKIGDDYLQKQAQGYAVPETFNHGTSAQRVRWLKRGATTGNMADADTFTPPYSSL